MEILLLTFVGIMLFSLFSYGASKANDKLSENLCRTFNVLRFATEIDAGPAKFKVAPNACKTINKRDELPSKEFKYNTQGEQEGAKAEIRDMMARCWWMWVEGKYQNMFNSKWYNLKNGCFICYSFSVADNKNVGTFTYEDFARSLNSEYDARDTSDKCAPLGQGGKCMEVCNDPRTRDDFNHELPSGKCSPQNGIIVSAENPQGKLKTEGGGSGGGGANGAYEYPKCCISTDECVNKGGICAEKEGYVPFEKWKCGSGTCYVKKENVASYLDYIQGTAGVGYGPGRVLFGDNEGFKPGLKYAVSFISPGNEFDLETGSRLLLSAGTAVATVYFVVQTAGLGLVPLATVGVAGAKIGLTAATYEGLMAGQSGTIRDINYIMVSKYDTIADKCSVAPGVGEK